MHKLNEEYDTAVKVSVISWRTRKEDDGAEAGT